MAVVTQDEPILSRLDRLDNLMRHLEMIRSGSNTNRSPKSSSPSTPSSIGTRDGHASSLDFSPRSRDSNRLHCRPIDDVIVETEHKGTLLDRVSLIEHRLLKVCVQLQLEQELEAEKQQQQAREVDIQKVESPQARVQARDKSKKKGLKQFVKSCVEGKSVKSCVEGKSNTRAAR